ncbi:MAG: hypothetical protein A2Y33_15080 [Spirochaetes bacterium GWF1_51_8]|nr:MAG: hypothetical protein A2Y33_15080 [Spirochaetes bacterium GWF1_51_8]
MKNGLLSFTLLLFLSCGGEVRPMDKATLSLGQDYVFDIKALPEIVIDISAGEWNKLLKYYQQNPENEECVHADFTFIKDGQSQTLWNIGFRVRGNGFSRVCPENDYVHTPGKTEWNQSHFRIDFDKFSPKQDFHTLKAMNLKAFNGDPAMVREIYCMDLFQRFGVFVAPKSAYVCLSIYVRGDPAPVYYGVYRMNESVDSVMIKNRFPGNKLGYLWKCLWPANLIHASMEGKIGIEDISPVSKGMSKSYPYDLKTKKKDFEKAKELLLDFAYNLNYLEGDELKKWLEQNFEVQLFLKAYAVNVMVGMWDDYWGNNNNYYLYRHPSGKWYFIPYDYDNTLGTAVGTMDATKDVMAWGSYAERPLIDKILSIPEYSKAYQGYIAELIDPKNGLFDTAASMARIAEWQAMIAESVGNDTTGPQAIKDKPADWGRYGYYRLLSGSDDTPGEVNYFLQKIKYVKEQLSIK